MKTLWGLAWFALATLGPGALLAQAQGYPVKPVRFIINFPPGGPTDIVGRMAADTLSRSWGVQVVADNRGGGASGQQFVTVSPVASSRPWMAFKSAGSAMASMAAVKSS